MRNFWSVVCLILLPTLVAAHTMEIMAANDVAFWPAMLWGFGMWALAFSAGFLAMMSFRK